MSKETKIIESWQQNAGSWIGIIDNNGIESRKLVTNKAIIDTINGYPLQHILDIGCGEGWLSRELTAKGIKASGIDVIPELIDQARLRVEGDFRVASYEDVYEKKIQFPALFDGVVINFALIGKESTEQLLAALPALLTDKGKLFIQTLWPQSRKEINDYISGWKPGSWDGLGDQFTLPYEWYFRTYEDWLILLDQSGFGIVRTAEPVHPHTGKPCSMIFIAEKIKAAG